jgi:hypothetical protein
MVGCSPMRLSEARKYLLGELDQFAGTGVVVAVQWLTAQNKTVCEACSGRDGKVYTFEQARAAVSEPSFCVQKDEGLGCRCVWLAVLEGSPEDPTYS